MVTLRRFNEIVESILGYALVGYTIYSFVSIFRYIDFSHYVLATVLSIHVRVPSPLGIVIVLDYTLSSLLGRFGIYFAAALAVVYYYTRTTLYIVSCILLVGKAVVLYLSGRHMRGVLKEYREQRFQPIKGEITAIN